MKLIPNATHLLSLANRSKIKVPCSHSTKGIRLVVREAIMVMNAAVSSAESPGNRLPREGIRTTGRRRGDMVFNIHNGEM